MGIFSRLRSLFKVGIRVRLVILMAVAAGALALDSYMDVVARRDQRVEEVKTRMLLVAQNVAGQQYEFASAARLLLGTVTNLAPSIEVCGDDFQQLADDAHWLKAISIADAEGLLLCSTGPLKPGTNIADRAYFKEAIKTRAFVLSDYILGRVHNIPLLVAAAPRIDDEGEIEAVIILSIELSFLDQIAENVGNNTTVFLVDGSNTVVSADKASRGLTGRNLSRDALFRTLAAEDLKVIEGRGPDGVSRLYASAQLTGTAARVIIGFPRAALFQPVYAAAQREVGKNTLFFVVLFSIAWLLADRVIIRPIRTLREAALAFGGGDRTVRVDMDKLPEDFTELVKTFHATADLLARNEALIVEKNRRLGDANLRLRELARRDELTGLANRRMLNNRLRNVFSKPTVEPVALLVLDLDKFKPVNDLMGHPVGDLVLKEVARRLSALRRRGDLVARLGGDEFAIVVKCGADAGCEYAREIARQIVRAMSAPFATMTGHVEIGGTVGVALSGRDASDPDELLRAADLAMYRAKRDERGGFRFFEKSMHAELQSRVSLETELRAGLKAGEIVPYYQPIVNLEDGRLVGLEILARWNHPSKGVLPPGVFIHVAAEVGLAESLTRQVLGAACSDARHWPEDIVLSVNLSPNQLGDPLLPTLMASIAADHDIAPRRLEVEITEDALIQDVGAARAVMQSFRSLGIRVALDDFGTGYSSLQSLHELRFDKIKIDRSFVSDLLTNEDSRKLVTAIISMARGLNLPVTAEGIEQHAVAGVLADLGCTYGQGYAFGRPMPAKDIAAIMRREGRATSSQVA